MELEIQHNQRQTAQRFNHQKQLDHFEKLVNFRHPVRSSFGGGKENFGAYGAVEKELQDKIYSTNVMNKRTNSERRPT